MCYTVRVVAGTLIKEARKRAGLTQAQLAALAGTKQSAIGRWERLEVDPGFERVRELTRLCGLDITFELAIADSSFDSVVERTLAIPVSERIGQMVRNARGFQTLRQNFIENSKTSTG